MSAARRLRRLLGNHVPKVAEFAREHNLPAGRLSEVAVFHDDWCGIHKGGVCRCDPEVKLMKIHFSADEHERN